MLKYNHNSVAQMLKKAFLSLIILGTGFLNMVAAQTGSDTTRTQKESDFYKINTVPIPSHIALEVGGMTFLPNDALAVSTRKGEVWIITNPYGRNGLQPQYKLFAQGLHEPLGLNYINGDLYLAQRAELTRLRDLDGDGEADEYHTVYSWPLAGNYHEYVYGPVLDKDGLMTITLNLGWIGFGESLSKWDGWMVKFSPDGKLIPFATGMRSPSGFGLNSEGDMFYAENQGDWVGSGSITHVAKGDFVGNPAGLIWADQPDSPVKLRKSDIPDTGEPKYDVAKRVPGLKPPSVWFPHTILGISTSGILNYDQHGKMGPFEDQLFVGDQGQSKIMRVSLEKIKGVYQGVVFPFREGFSSGILRMNWGSDGSMFVGMTSRGWGSTGNGMYGLQQLVWNGKIPFEIKTVKAKPDGFEMEFTEPVDLKSAQDPASYAVSSFNYKYHHHYGSPVINQGARQLKAIVVSDDRLKVRLVIDSLKEGYIHELKVPGVRSKDHFALLHNYGYYTLNQIPDGDKVIITDANRVKLSTALHDHTTTSDSKVKNETKKPSIKRQVKQPESWKSGPDRTLVLKPEPGLKFNVQTITIKAGTKIKLTFDNTDDMLHNVVITAPGSATLVGEQAIKLGLDGQKLQYVPKSDLVLFHTNLLQPNQSETIYFTAPDKTGDYEFVCTYPGHYMVMRGVIKVVPR
jgi:azurin/glucose/arabinose dehydrogenase